MARTIELGENTSDSSKLLQALIQSGNLNFLIGSGASVPAIATAAGIEKEINDLLADDKRDEADLKALDFIQAIASVHLELGKPEKDEIKKCLDQYVEFISVVDRILFERKNNNILPRQSNLFTTNYDLFIEHAAAKSASLILNDGFARTPGEISNFHFAPERYADRTYRGGTVYSHPAEVPTINLVKLHGSLSWRRKDGDIAYDASKISSLKEEERTDPVAVRGYLERFFLVLPNLMKFHSTMMDRFYYDLLRMFANSLEKENALLVCFGFSFEDEHILDVTRRALRNPTAQLIIFSHSETSTEIYQRKFEEQRNVIIFAPPVGEKLEFSKLNVLLKSVLPSQ